MRRGEEDKRIRKYQENKNMMEKIDDEKREKRLRGMKLEMKAQLDQQIQEKKNRAVMEKNENRKIAEVWKQDKQDYDNQEKKAKEKTEMVNKDYANYLKMQMDENRKNKKNVMNREEYLMNKQLLEAAEGKVKTDES